MPNPKAKKREKCCICGIGSAWFTDGSCKACRRDPNRKITFIPPPKAIPLLEDDDEDDSTEEELESLVQQGLAKKPKWWSDEERDKE
jgi:hypothetical protein